MGLGGREDDSSTGHTAQEKEMGLRVELVLTVQHFNRIASTPNGLALVQKCSNSLD